jgi:hypothetical protein
VAQLMLLLVTLFFLFTPRPEVNVAPNRIIIPYEQLRSPETYAGCDRAFAGCTGPLCGIDRDYCVTWRKP